MYFCNSIERLHQSKPEIMKRILFLLLALHLLTVKAKDYNIIDYGAKIDTTILSTTALQRIQVYDPFDPEESLQLQASQSD